MKKTITLLSFVLMVTAVSAQFSVVNHSFENWSQNGPYMWPDNWEAYDSTTTAQLGLLERRVGGTDGSYSIKLNSYDDGTSFPMGAWLQLEDSFAFEPKAFAIDYIIPPGSSYFNSVRVNLYFYDSLQEYINDISINLTEQSSNFKNKTVQLGFSGVVPKYYAMDVKFQNVTGEAGEYAIVDNVRFLSTYTPPPPPPTGMDEVEKLKISMYPNPANNMLYFNNAPANVKTVRIIGVDGKEVQLLTMNNIASGLNITSIPTGVFFIELLDKEGVLLGRSRFAKAE